MLALDDPSWETFHGAYRTPYNAAIRLKELETGEPNLEQIWEEFWEELHHQGDVGLASYATVTQLVRITIARNLFDWNVFALVAVIEECRLFGENPILPTWLEVDYSRAIKQLAEFGAQHFCQDWPEELTQAILAVVAFSKNAPNTGRIPSKLSEDEMKEVFDKFFE